LKNFLSNGPALVIERENSEDLLLDLKLERNGLNIKVGALYGNQIPNALFQQDYSISDLLLLRYDDIWLSQLLAIDERTSLLKNGRNYLIILRGLLKRDRGLRVKYDELIESECGNNQLTKITTYLLQQYSSLLEDNLIPNHKTKEEYLADVVQVLSASEA